MLEWIGNWKAEPEKQTECECGKKNGAKVWIETFEAENFDSLIHEGVTRICISYFCYNCAKSMDKILQSNKHVSISL